MKIALVHYHLRRGGVTQVMMNQAKALAKAGVDVLVIAGEKPPFQTDFPFALVEMLGYAQPAEDGTRHPALAEKLAGGILRAMEERWGRQADIVHAHNPLIQKNYLFIPALKIMADRGARLLLQNHDMAEDFRPDVYYADEEYPADCHYAVINSRDYDLLNRAGLERECLHLIPNEVSPLPRTAGLKKTLVLYPVRAIRRKNIGEALLLSMFVPQGAQVAVTLPPSTAGDKKYERWVSFAAECGLPVEFAAGEKSPLADLAGRALCAVTTSVKEGFGFSFLEPWTCGLALAGRRIDYVCRDFENSGLRFDKLYSSLEVSRDYIPAGSLEKKMEGAMERIYGAFKTEMPSSVRQVIADDLSGDVVDFGRLDEELQEAVIGKLLSSEGEKLKTAQLNPALGEIGEAIYDGEQAEANRLAVEKNYGSEKKQALLLETYEAVMKKNPRHKINKTALLDLYLDPRRLSLVGISDG